MWTVRWSTRQTARLLVIALFCFSVEVRPAEIPARAWVPVEEIRLQNGMKFLVVQRSQGSTIAAGWIAKVGSADEDPDQTGLSHLVEHLMFKGTRVVGARDLEGEQALFESQERLHEELLRLRQELDEPRPPTRKKRRLKRRESELQGEIRRLGEVGRSLSLLGEFSLLYSEIGATGLNAHTLKDMSLYLVELPAEKLEAWFWLESDRLLQPVFRQFFIEKEVIDEERRLRIESTPTGRLEQQLDARFWGEHPYAWPTMGQAAHLNSLSRADVDRFFARHYRPGNLTAALVGPLDPQRVRFLAEKYFGRLAPGSAPGPNDGSTISPPPIPAAAEKRWSAPCDCPSQVRILYPSVPFNHPDTYALDLLAGLMNGRSGRLYRSLVLDRGIAFSAVAGQNSSKRQGYFSFRAETKGKGTPEDLVSAWDAVLERLLELPIPAVELRRVKNRLVADTFRGLKDGRSLLRRLLVYEGLGDWRYVNKWAEQILVLEAASLRRVAGRYLDPAHRTVALFRRKSGDEGSGPAGGAG